MKRFKIILILLFLGSGILSAQETSEREYRIKKSQFPQEALNYISNKLEDARRIRFYKENDSSQINFKAKFKKDRLWYTTEFNKEGVLKGIAISIQPVDIPNDAYTKIEAYLTSNFSKYRIRRLHQKYPITAAEPAETTIKKAFQNLMIPEMVYDLFVKAKKDGEQSDFEITFDSEGTLILIKKALPANYDKVLY